MLVAEISDIGQRLDLEHIVRLLYPLFGRLRRNEMRNTKKGQEWELLLGIKAEGIKADITTVRNQTISSSEKSFSEKTNFGDQLFRNELLGNEHIKDNDEQMLTSSISLDEEQRQSEIRGLAEAENIIAYLNLGAVIYGTNMYLIDSLKLTYQIASALENGAFLPRVAIIQGDYDSNRKVDYAALPESSISKILLGLQVSEELKQAISEYHGNRTGNSAVDSTVDSTGSRAIRRQDKLDVVPKGREIGDGLYSLDLSLDLKIEGSAAMAHYAQKTLMRVKTSAGVETIELDSGSTIAKAYRALDDKGLVGIFEKSDAGKIELKEVLGLEGAKLDLIESNAGGIAINYYGLDRRVDDFDYINRNLVMNPESSSHGYDFMKPVIVTEERARDGSARSLSVLNEQGIEESYEVRNNSAIAIMADAMLDNGYTPEIRKMEVLSNDGSKAETAIYIKNAYKNNWFGQKQELITDTNHGGLWVEVLKGSSRSEFVDPTGCSLNLERATPLPGQVIEARLGVVGRYDNRRY